GQVVPTTLLHEDENRRNVDIATLRERIEEYRKEWKGKLRTKIVLLGLERDFSQPTQAASKRSDDKELSTFTEQPELEPGPKPDWVPDKLPRDPKKRALALRNLPLEMMADYW